MGLECPICLELYNLNTRQPKVLQCSHSLCDSCVSRLRYGTTVDCPTCRHSSQMKEVKVNFGLRDEVVEKCEACLQHKRHEKCHHCHQELCDACLKEHVGFYHDQLKAKIDKLQRDVVTAAGQTIDQAVMDCETLAQEQTLKKISEAYEHQAQCLKDEMARLTTEVTNESETNIGKYQEWEEHLDVQLRQCKNLIRKFRANLASKHVTSLTTGQMAEMEGEVDCATKELAVVMTGQPTASTRVFAANKNQISLGMLQAHDTDETNTMTESLAYLKVSNLGKPAESPRDAELYRRVNHVATIGADSGPDELGTFVCLACMKSRIFILDVKNHGLKMFDTDLQLLCIIGEEGLDKYCFKHPNGICCIENEVFISDTGNNRIKVYNKYGQLLRTFGPECPVDVTNDYGLFRPLGLTGGPDRLLYVCDKVASAVQVFQLDGTYVRSIGNASIFSGEPHSVAISSVGTTFVLDMCRNGVHMFTCNGQHLKMVSCNDAVLEEMTIDKRDNVILADSMLKRLIVLSPNGDIICTTRLNDITPGDIISDEDGGLLVGDLRTQRVHRFTFGQ